jgi:hypothetical protein
MRQPRRSGSVEPQSVRGAAHSHAQTFVALQCGWFLLVIKGLCALAPSFLFEANKFDPLNHPNFGENSRKRV